MAFVKCTFSDGLRDQEATVRVVDDHGQAEFLPVDRGILDNPEQREGENDVSVGVVQVNKKEQAVLVTLPVESDSGAHRIWVTMAGVKNLKRV